MDIGAISAQTQAQGNSTKVEDGNSFGKDKFLQLLVAQMKNQDPINPMDGKEFASQLAEFNSVEQLIGVNDGLSSLQNSQEMMRTEMTNSMAASLTGKHVRALSNRITLEDGGDVNVRYELNNTAEEMDIIVKDASGSEVRRESFAGVAKGENSWTWDGKNSDGVPMPGGEYTVEVDATNGDKAVGYRMFTEGIANRVRFTGNGVMLSIDGVEVPIGNVETVGNSF
jgi:flagellar basal-body rod modification protein FlgD